MSSCPQCGANNVSDARFCNQCGSPLGATDPSQSAERQAYTPRHLLDRVLRHRAALEGERKQVTVLFADMAGSTRLAEQVDPELWHRILDDYFAILCEEVHRYEGTVNQFTGDGIMALFGAPLALEDHALCAARAALALKQRLGDFADRLRIERGLNLSTRMGMNSGEVVVGRIGDDLRMDYTAKGMTVNLAARMEQIAAPGSVYLARDTAELIADYVELRALGPMTVKGSSEAVPVYELQGLSGVSLRIDAARARGLTGFSGRDRELAQLDSLRRGVDERTQRQILVIQGDAGLGKSRLCLEALERWRQQGVEIMQCSGLPHGQAEPLQPVRELLRQRFAIQPGDPTALARQKLAGGLLVMGEQMRAHLPLLFEFLNLRDAERDGPVPAPEVRDQRLRELFGQLCLISSPVSRVILIEDLHWMDEGSQDFLRGLLDCGACTQTLVLFNMRPGPLPDWLSAWQPHVLPLQPLESHAIEQVTRSLLGGGPDMDALATTIAQRAAGNPFFVEETVRALAAAGRLVGAPGAYALSGPLRSLRIPASVQAVIAGRVDRLHQDDKQLLQVAAVLGLRLEKRLLAAVAERDQAELAETLRRLEQGHYLVVDADEPQRLLFSHPLLQEVVYDSLLSDQRKLLHRRVAERLEPFHAREGCLASLLLLARHWDAAGDALKAARWNLQAGNAMARHDLQEEVRYLRRVIELLEPLPAGIEARKLMIEACAGLVRVAGFMPLPADEIDACYAKARRLADELAEAEPLALLLISNGVRLLNAGDADQAVAHVSEAMVLAQGLPDNSLEARFRIPILFSYFSAGRVREGLALLDRRDGGAWHQGEVQEDTMLSRGFRALMLAVLGDLVLAVGEARQALACARRFETSVSWLHANLVDVLLMRGELEDGREQARIAQQQAESYGSPFFMEIAARAGAQVYLASGEPGRASAILLDTLALVAPDAVACQFESVHRMLLAQAQAACGQHAQANEQIAWAIAAAQRSHQRLWLLRAHITAAHLTDAQAGDMSGHVEIIEELIAETGAELFRGDWLELKARQAEQDSDPHAGHAYREQAIAHWLACGARPRAQALREALVA